MREVPWEDMAIIVGASFSRVVTIYDEASDESEAVANIAGCTLTWLWRDILTGDAVFAKALTISSPLSGQGVLDCSGAEMAILTPDVPYLYVVVLHDTANNDSVVAAGGFSVIGY